MMGTPWSWGEPKEEGEGRVWGEEQKAKKRRERGRASMGSSHLFFWLLRLLFCCIIAVSRFERTSRDRINIWFSYVCSKSHVLAMNQGVKLDEKEIRSRKDTPNTRQTLSSSLPLITTLYEIDIYYLLSSINNKEQQSTMILYRIRA